MAKAARQTKPQPKPATTDVAKQYSFAVEYDAVTKLFCGSVKEIPGCHSLGDSRIEATENLEKAVADWCGVALKKGVALPKPDTDHSASGRFLLRMPIKLHSRAIAAARQERASLNSIVVTALASYLGEWQAETRLENCLRTWSSQVILVSSCPETEQRTKTMLALPPLPQIPYPTKTTDPS